MDIPERAPVVIIGGGAVGASILYHLGLAGRSGCVLLERDELTAGSTWHAAGNCPNFATSWAVMNIQRYSTALYRGLAEAVEYPINYHVTGAVRLAHSAERMAEFEHVRAMGAAQGLRMRMMDVEEVRACHPLLRTHDLVGGLWDPEDGDIDPAQLTQALARGARTHGGIVLRHTAATGVTCMDPGWIVHTARGDIACDHVVNAAGYYAGRIAEWFALHGRPPLPMAVMSHQYLLTEPVPEIADWTRTHGRKTPMIRDPDASYYLRQEKTGLNLGPYERDCVAEWTSGRPAGGFQLPPLATGPRPAGALYRRRDGAGPGTFRGGHLLRRERADPLRARRPAAAGADAGGAECLGCQFLHVRHRTGGRGGAGHGRLDPPGCARLGLPRRGSAPLRRLGLGPDLRRGPRAGDLRPRIRDALSPCPLACRGRPSDLAPSRPAAGAGRRDGPPRRMGAGDLVRASRRRYRLGRDADLAPRRPMARPRGGGGGGGHDELRRPGPVRFRTVRDPGRRLARGSRPRRVEPPAQGGPRRARLFRRTDGPVRDRVVDAPDRGGNRDPDRRGRGAGPRPRSADRRPRRPGRPRGHDRTGLLPPRHGPRRAAHP